MERFDYQQLPELGMAQQTQYSPDSEILHLRQYVDHLNKLNLDLHVKLQDATNENHRQAHEIFNLKDQIDNLKETIKMKDEKCNLLEEDKKSLITDVKFYENKYAPKRRHRKKSPHSFGYRTINHKKYYFPPQPTSDYNKTLVNFLASPQNSPLPSSNLTSSFMNCGSQNYSNFPQSADFYQQMPNYSPEEIPIAVQKKIVYPNNVGPRSMEVPSSNEGSVVFEQVFSSPVSIGNERFSSFEHAVEYWKQRYQNMRIFRVEEQFLFGLDLRGYLFDPNGPKIVPQIVKKAMNCCVFYRSQRPACERTHPDWEDLPNDQKIKWKNVWDKVCEIQRRQINIDKLISYRNDSFQPKSSVDINYSNFTVKYV